MDLKEIQEIIKAENITALRMEYPDLYGICRNKMVPAKNLEHIVEEGLNFAQAIYAINLANDVAPETGCGYEIEWRDMTIMPDLGTFVEIEGPDEATIHRVQKTLGLETCTHVSESYACLVAAKKNEH